MIEFRGLTKYNNSYLAVNYLDQKFDSNRLAIYGVEGSGKSSLLRLIAGLDKPTEGQILINGKEVVGVDKNTYFTFRNNKLLNNMTLRDNLIYPLKLRNEDNINSRVDEALTCFELINVQNVKPKYLTFEDKARVVLAKIFLRKTDILLLDNPFEMLDNSTRKAYFDRLLGLVKDYKGNLIYATDNLDELSAFTNAVILNYGVVKGAGKLYDIVNNPTNLFGYNLFTDAMIFNGKLMYDNGYYFVNNSNEIAINENISARLISNLYIGKDVILATHCDKNSAENDSKFDINNLNNSMDIWLFDWNENSILK